LRDQVEVSVRFSEVDALGIVWHGHYVKYLEDGRESFGNTFGLGYQEVYDQGLRTPLVKLDMDYKEQVRYGEKLLIETTWVPCDAAKIILDYRVLRASGGQVVLTARSIQVFLNEAGDLELNNPAFYQEWKRRNGVLEEGGTAS